MYVSQTTDINIEIRKVKKNSKFMLQEVHLLIVVAFLIKVFIIRIFPGVAVDIFRNKEAGI